jgi:ribosome-associated toxin RatA of RatAB toxin-antitoxin module
MTILWRQSLVAMFALGTLGSSSGSPPGPEPNPSPWEEVRNAHGITIWQRRVPGSAVREVKVETVFDAPPGRIWEVIQDVPRRPEWMPFVSEAQVVVPQQGNSRSVYQRIDPPLVSDRDYTVRNTSRVDPQAGVFEQEFVVRNEDGPPPAQGVVRVTVIRGRWSLEPVGVGKTRIRYWVHTDPGGAIPAWMVNYGSRYSVQRLLEAIERRALDPSWRR